MSKKRRYFTPALVVIALLLAMVELYRPAFKVYQIKRSIKRALPQDATKSQVIAFLDSHKIKHSAYVDDKESGLLVIGAEVPDEKKGLVKGRMDGTIDNAGPFLDLLDSDIWLHFYFEENGKLVHYTVKAFGVFL